MNLWIVRVDAIVQRAALFFSPVVHLILHLLLFFEKGAARYACNQQLARAERVFIYRPFRFSSLLPCCAADYSIVLPTLCKRVVVFTLMLLS